MPTPDARPVGETALTRDRFLHLLATHLVAGQEMTEHDRRLCDAALVAYCDAVAAEMRATLLRDATAVWVATDAQGRFGAGSEMCRVFMDEPEPDPDGSFHRDSRSHGGVWLCGVPALTPPGTVRRAYLVIQEGEET